MLRFEGGGGRPRQDRAPAQARIAWVGVENAFVDARSLGVPEGGHGLIGAHVSDRDLGAQLIEAKPLGEIGRLPRRAVDEIRRLLAWRAHHDHVEQDLALRREQRRIACFARMKPFDVVGQQALQKASRILAAYANDGAILEHGGFLVHGEGSGRACKRAHCQIGRFCATARKIAMPPSFDCVLTNGAVVNQDGIGLRDIGVRDGRIAEIGDLSRAAAGERLDCQGLHILPGVIDSQVHFREPGLVHKEDLETGSRAGDFRRGDRGVRNAQHRSAHDKRRRARRQARARERPHALRLRLLGRRHARNVADIPDLERLPGAAGIKVFMGSSTGRLLVADDEGVLAILKQTRRRAAFHSEDEARLNERKPLRVAGDPSSHPVWRDEVAALRSTERLVRLARQAGAQVHVLHISTREEMASLAAAKDVASCEATPHHPTLSADDYSRLGTKIQMNPPVRGPDHRDAIWRGIEQGVVDVLGSDHAPTRSRKRPSLILRARRA